MKLNLESLKNQGFFEENKIELPKFNYEQVKENTTNAPKWIHFGGGNIFRAFIANAHQNILDSGKADTGIVAVESFDFEVADRVYRPFDNLSLLVTMTAGGEFKKKVIGSVVESLTTDATREDETARLIEIFENPSLQMVSFTITEKGYGLKDAKGDYLGVVKSDIDNGLEAPKHTMSIITALAYKRYLKGAYPLTFVSMDNCSHNGDKLKDAVLTIAKAWQDKGYVEEDFVNYLSNESKVTYPLSMIDKITPRPSEVVQEHLEKVGMEEMDVIVTSKNSYMAPFVNAEVSEYLIVEDKFTNGRPELESGGVIFTSRETVNQTETMKVTTCLNPLHTALAVTGCLLDYTLIADQMKDETLVKLVKKIGYDEGLKVVVDPKIINPKSFIDEVVNERLTNPFIPDTPQRIATDTSQKVGIRFGETIKSYVKRDDLDPKALTAIPLAIAAWCRYLLGVNDEGDNFTISSDPLKDDLTAILEGVKLGDTTSKVKEIIGNESIFGIDLYAIGLGDKVEEMFYKMIAGKGAVRKTLEEYL